VGDSKEMQNQCDGDWLCSRWWRILSFAVSQLPLDSEIDLSSDILSDIFGPQAGELLTHGTKRVLHCPRSDGPFAGRDSAITVSLREQLEHWDRILVAPEERVEAILNTECSPAVPMVVEGVGVFRINAGSDRFLNKAAIRLEFSGLRTWQSCQGSACGNCKLKCVSSSSSDRCQALEH